MAEWRWGAPWGGVQSTQEVLKKCESPLFSHPNIYIFLSKRVGKVPFSPLLKRPDKESVEFTQGWWCPHVVNFSIFQKKKVTLPSWCRVIVDTIKKNVVLFSW